MEFLAYILFFVMAVVFLVVAFCVGYTVYHLLAGQCALWLQWMLTGIASLCVTSFVLKLAWPD